MGRRRSSADRATALDRRRGAVVVPAGGPLVATAEVVVLKTGSDATVPERRRSDGTSRLGVAAAAQLATSTPGLATPGRLATPVGVAAGATGVVVLGRTGTPSRVGSGTRTC